MSTKAKGKSKNILSNIQIKIVGIMGATALVIYFVYMIIATQSIKVYKISSRIMYTNALQAVIADKYFLWSNPSLKNEETITHLEERFKTLIDQGILYRYITDARAQSIDPDASRRFNLIYHLALKASQTDDVPTLTIIYESAYRGDRISDLVSMVEEVNKTVMSDQIMIMTLIISMLIAFITLQVTAIRITNIARVSRNLLKENEIIDISQRVHYQASDEMGFIARNLNLFFEKLERAISGANIAMRKALYQSTQLFRSSQGWLQETQEMGRSIDVISGQMNHQINSVNQAASALEEMERTLDIIFSNISRQSAAMTESAATLEEMGRQVESVAKISDDTASFATKLTEIADKGSQAVDASVISIRDVAEYSSQIIKLLKLITGIAKQTNLLAMNASIEAAHAGESGRGFAIVAEEIRRLSETTNKNAKEIGTVVDTMVDKIENSVAQAQLAGEELQQVNIYAKNVADRTSELNNMMQEQNTATHEMLSAIEGLVTLAQEIKLSMEEQQQGLREYSGSMVRLKENFGETKQTLDEHMMSVQKLLQILRDAGIRINIEKESMTEILQFLDGFNFEESSRANIAQIAKDQETLFLKKRSEENI
ncbi:MAG: methyl-accepting chemotaxis protein [Brevinema sp.]